MPFRWTVNPYRGCTHAAFIAMRASHSYLDLDTGHDFDSKIVVEAVAAIAEAGATSLTPSMLHLRPGAREWYHAWLSRERRDLLPLYERLYRNGAYAPKSYQREFTDLVEQAKRRHGLADPQRSENFRTQRHDPPQSDADRDRERQLSLM
ncbi:hypothetical protein [Saccharopolyspora hattusasensis]|uniref:hypothetical protein n=1 Tax=Saccharopolyspora hattusasensis TaxID=1128679 RepID=UPI003D98720C